MILGLPSVTCSAYIDLVLSAFLFARMLAMRHRCCVQAFVHGFRRWVRTPLHIIDLIIVCISLALEVTAVAISETAVEVGGLLVVFRLWRVVRVMHAVGEVEHQTHKDVHSDLEMANVRLQHVSEAHHAIIKELHREYTRRVCLPPARRLVV